MLSETSKNDRVLSSETETGGRGELCFHGDDGMVKAGHVSSTSCYLHTHSSWTPRWLLLSPDLPSCPFVLGRKRGHLHCPHVRMDGGT